MNKYSVIRLLINGEQFIAVKHITNEEDYNKEIESMYSAFDGEYDGEAKANKEAKRLSKQLGIPLH